LAQNTRQNSGDTKVATAPEVATIAAKGAMPGKEAKAKAMTQKDLEAQGGIATATYATFLTQEDGGTVLSSLSLHHAALSISMREEPCAVAQLVQ
jgi:hypothetical protein